MIIFHDLFILNTYCLSLTEHFTIALLVASHYLPVMVNILAQTHTGYGQERWTMSTYFCFSYYLHIQLWQKWEKLQTSSSGNMKSKCTLKKIVLGDIHSTQHSDYPVITVTCKHLYLFSDIPGRVFWLVLCFPAVLTIIRQRKVSCNLWFHACGDIERPKIELVKIHKCSRKHRQKHQQRVTVQ